MALAMPSVIAFSTLPPILTKPKSLAVSLMRSGCNKLIWFFNTSLTALAISSGGKSSASLLSA